MGWELAQVNIARLRAPLDSPTLAGFVAALDHVNALAESAPGYRWRLQSEDGDATSIRAFEWDTGQSDGVIVNMSVWESPEHLAAFVYSPEHLAILRRRREWFHHMTEAYSTQWWVPAGQWPSTDDAEEKVRHLRNHGPTPTAFTLRATFPPPDAPDPASPIVGAIDAPLCA